MDKSKNLLNRISWICTILAALCGVLSFCMFFAKAVAFDLPILGKSTYSGLQTAFGYTESGIEIFHASAGVALAFILPLIAACIAVLGQGNKITAAIAASFFIAASVLAFCIPHTINGNFAAKPTLGAGGIVCAVLSLVGAGAECAHFFLKR